jgi:hypothetical protein
MNRWTVHHPTGTHTITYLATIGLTTQPGRHLIQHQTTHSAAWLTVTPNQPSHIEPAWWQPQLFDTTPTPPAWITTLTNIINNLHHLTKATT